MKQIGWDLKNGVIWPIHPVKGVKEIKHVKINFYSLINHYKAILTPFGYVTILPPGGDGAKVVIAFNVKKTKFMVFHSRQKNIQLHVPELKIGDKVIANLIHLY